MTKAELVAKMAAHLDMPKAQVRRVVDSVVDTLTGALKKGEKVAVSGLGVFEVKSRKSREGRNPRTGAPIKISARKAVVFRAANPLKEAVN